MAVRGPQLLAALVITTALAPGVASAAAPAAGRPVPGEVVVGFERGTTASERVAARRDAGVAAERGSRLEGVQLVKVAPGESVDDAVARLQRDPNVAYAQPNRWRTAAASVPNDPLMGQLWGLARIQAPAAWDVFKGVDTLVAVVDEGIEYDHPDLAPNMWANPGEAGGTPGADDDGNGIVDDIRGADFVDPFDPDGDPRDIGGHGTHVAGTIAARGDNGLGITGVNQRARLMAVRVLGPGGGSDFAIAEGFDYAAEEGARVVNASLGGDGESPVLNDAMARHPNTLFVVAAGNDGRNVDPPNEASSPCTEDNANLVCVAATTPSEDLATFSNTGATSVDLGAPGTVVLSAGLGRTRLSDGFEGGDFTTRWNRHVDQGSTGPWGTVSPGAASGTSITDSPGGIYAPNVRSYADLATPLSLSGASGCVLHFTVRLALGSGDIFAVDRSINGGSSFQRRDAFAGSTSGVFRSVEVALNADNQASVLIRFGLEANSTGTGDGVNVDDVAVICAQPSTPGTEAYVFLDGTSMASPHVAGAAALLLGARPSLTVPQLKAALLNTGDPQPELAGETTTGRRLNLDKALRSVVPAPTTTPTTTATATPTATSTSPPPTTTSTQPARPSVADIAKRAQVTCTRVRRTVRCRVTNTTRAVRIRLVLRRRGRVVARAAGVSGSRIKLRGGKPGPGRYTAKLTILENDEKATATKRIRIR